MTLPHHVPVMVDEVISYLPREMKTAIDCTTGGGGHSEAILRNSPDDLLLLCIDRDPTAIELTQERLKPFHNVHYKVSGFSHIKLLAEEFTEGGFDLVFIDQGQSMDQLKIAERGFSFSKDGMLNMRYDMKSEQTAATIVNQASFENLKSIIKDLGEERAAGKIADAIIKSRPIDTTVHLAEVVGRVVPQKFRVKSLARVFMALRMAVNEELDELQGFLDGLVDSMSAGSRCIALSYDSQQDRPIKQFFKEKSQDCTCPPNFPVCVCDAKAELKTITKKAVMPSSEEIDRNPSSRSARLRVAEKINTDL